MTTRWDIGRRFYVVQCNPRQEFVARAEALKQGWQITLPHRVYIKRVRGHKPRTIKEAYLPGYMFAVASNYSRDGSTALSVHDLGKAHGVLGVLRTGYDYAQIPDTDPVMRALLKMTDDNGVVPEPIATLPISRYRPGDRVSLQNCPYALHEAVIEMVDDNRTGAWVWLSMFGSQVKTRVRDDQIGEVVV
jgi:transcription antitermination factor NusG